MLFFTVILFAFASGYPINENSSRLFENDLTGPVVRSEKYFVQLTNGTIYLHAALDSALTWRNRTVPYLFSSTFDEVKRSKVKQAMDIMSNKTCIQFIPRTFEHSYIMFIQDPDDSCFSFPGRKTGEQAISLPDWCLKHQDNIFHELMHTLGFLHEQNRHDRDQHITIHWENVIGSPENIDWKKRNEYELLYFGTDYDFESVMHYPAVIAGKPVITPKRPGIVIKSNGLSRNDIFRINRFYDCHDEPTTDSDVTMIPLKKSVRRNNFTYCENNKFYCGQELKNMGYKNIEDENVLYSCDNGRALYHTTCHDGCLKDYDKSKCACRNDKLYCGFELHGMNWGINFDNKGYHLYKCFARSMVHLFKVCSVKCVKQSQAFEWTGDSMCSLEPRGRCQAGTAYCGYELSLMQYKSAHAQSLYVCGNNNKGNFVKKCENGCEFSAILSNGHTNSTCNTKNKVVLV